MSCGPEDNEESEKVIQIPEGTLKMIVLEMNQDDLQDCLHVCLRSVNLSPSYRMFMKSYDTVVKAAKKKFCTAPIVSASSHQMQLFRVIRLLTSLMERSQNNKILAIC